jgi:hypothetical protein
MPKPSLIYFNNLLFFLFPYDTQNVCVTSLKKYATLGANLRYTENLLKSYTLSGQLYTSIPRSALHHYKKGKRVWHDAATKLNNALYTAAHKTPAKFHEVIKRCFNTPQFSSARTYCWELEKWKKTITEMVAKTKLPDSSGNRTPSCPASCCTDLSYPGSMPEILNRRTSYSRKGYFHF